MKKIITILAGFLITLGVFSQASNTFKYVINADGGIVLPLGNIQTQLNTKLSKADSTSGAGKYATDHRADLIEAAIADTTAFVTLEMVGDTTVTASVGRIIFKTSDTHFYGCRKLTGKKWYQLNN